MNVYKIEQSVNDRYYTYDSAVVVAKSEEAARVMDPSGNRYKWCKANKCWIRRYIDKYAPCANTSWADPKDVKVTKIGVSDERKPRVVCASFNEG